MRLPLSVAICWCRESTAGIDEAPGNEKPSTSDRAGHRRGGAHRHARAGTARDPALDQAEVVLGDRAGAPLGLLPDIESELEHRPRQSPRNIGPAGTKMAGRFMLIAPIINAGVVLSQPPINTTPSAGYERSSSSVSIANKLRYIIVVGF